MKHTRMILVAILALACVVRLYRIDNPVADWHSWRQADTSSVSRIFAAEGFDLLHPRFHDMSNVPSGFDNPQGYRFVEFPIFNVLQAGLFTLFNGFSLEMWGRLVSIFSAVVGIAFLFGIVRRFAGVQAGLFASFFYAFLPFNVYFGRVILPEPLMTMSYLGAIYFFIRYVEGLGRNKTLYVAAMSVISLLFASSSLLLKPFAAFFLLPIVAITYQHFKFRMVVQWQLYVYAIITITPLLLWRYWMQQYPSGIPVNDWLFNGGNIRFTGAFFFWIFADRIGRLILGYFGIGILVLGHLAAVTKKTFHSFVTSHEMITAAFFLSALFYLFVVARGNVQHDYYQIPIIPVIAMYLGIGASFLLKQEIFNRLLSRILLAVLILGCFGFGWYHVRDYFNINNPNIMIAGEAVDQLTPPDAKVITFYGGDTSFLYQTKRSGWASLQNPLPEMIQKGATHLAIVNPTDQDREGLGKEYPVIASTDTHLILQLN